MEKLDTRMTKFWSRAIVFRADATISLNLFPPLESGDNNASHHIIVLLSYCVVYMK